MYKMGRYLYGLTVLLVLLTSIYALADERVSMILQFRSNRELSKELWLKYFSPVEDGVVAYNQYGEEVIINKSDTILITTVETGEYENFNGNWLIRWQRKHDDLWIPYTAKMKNVTAERLISRRAEIAVEKAEKLRAGFLNLGTYILLMLPFVYVGYLVKKHAPHRVSSLSDRGSYL